MGKRFQHPSEHATNLTAANETPMRFAQIQLQQQYDTEDNDGIEQWLCVIAILKHRGVKQ